MKTIVSLALVGLMSISALLPALAAQEAENVSIPESSGISESMAQEMCIRDRYIGVPDLHP